MTYVARDETGLLEDRAAQAGARAPNRLAGGLIDRSRTLSFRWDGRAYEGHPGDTLASALLANGERLMGRSFKYHRPRGPLTADSSEPNALVTLREGARAEPNTRATTAELYDGLVARPQNCWPSLRHDALAINDRLQRFFAAGFYYKTFMWPKAFWERLYEPLIRRAAGLGALSQEPDPDAYDKGYLHCDLLVIGAGPAGLMAALTAGRAGARVILADEDPLPGGRLLAETEGVGGQAGHAWAAGVAAELASMPGVRVMPRTCVIGAFDHGIYGALERVADHLAVPPEGAPRQTLWRIYAGRAVLAAGATERPVVFQNNDRPGVMLASAVRAYANRWAAAPDRRVAVFGNAPDAARTARDLRAKGVEVVAQATGEAVVADVHGRLAMTGITLREGGAERRIDCGALAVAGGWSPNVHLTCHQRGRPVWREDIAAFVPGRLPHGMSAAGACAGAFSTHAALREGAAAAAEALSELGIAATAPDLPEAEDAPYEIRPLWFVEGATRAWVDQQNDVTAKDVALSHQEGFRSVEHLKHYTTLGLATDQGKTSNVAGLAIMAHVAGRDIPGVGTTIFRPPYTPVAIGALGGRARGRAFKPTRLTPTHALAAERGAAFVEVGQWMRAQYTLEEGETHWREATDREVARTRSAVGLCDVSTLGKIDVQGTDAAEFLNRIYANGFAKLPVGRCRYGLMLREDGIVMDDGTAARLAEDHFVVTTTTANAVPVFRHMEFARQCLWPDLDVQLVSTTEAWAQISVAGPRARDLLRRVIDPEHDISNEAFPYLACGPVTVCGGLRARLFRISFSGELAYEIAVPTRWGDAVARRLLEAGAEWGATLYGTEALGVMRIEKGHAAGSELNGTATAMNLGLGRMVSDKKDSIGAVLSRREGLCAGDGLRLVGLRPVDPAKPVPAGAHLISLGDPAGAAHDQGYVTSACHSPTLGHAIALGYLARGAERHGERIRLVSPLTGADHEVEVCSPHFVDPDGARLRA